MNNLRRRKFNVYYWTCIVVAVCMLVFSDFDWQIIIAMLTTGIVIPFVYFDERGKDTFPDMEVEDE